MERIKKEIFNYIKLSNKPSLQEHFKLLGLYTETKDGQKYMIQNFVDILQSDVA